MIKLKNIFLMLVVLAATSYGKDVLNSSVPEIVDGAGTPSGTIMPLQISIFTPIQLVPQRKDITGLKLNIIYGYNEGIYGIDVGIASKAKNTSSLQLNLMNIVDAYGQGLQMGLFNIAEDYSGLQFGIFNSCGSQFSGLQAGIFNSAPICTGLQLGLINSCSSMRGVQIGLVNIIAESNVSFMPIMNMKF